MDDCIRCGADGAQYPSLDPSLAGALVCASCLADEMSEEPEFDPWEAA